MSFEFILLRLEIVIRDWISKFEIQIELDLETEVDHKWLSFLRLT